MNHQKQYLRTSHFVINKLRRKYKSRQQTNEHHIDKTFIEEEYELFEEEHIERLKEEEKKQSRRDEIKLEVKNKFIQKIVEKYLREIYWRYKEDLIIIKENQEQLIKSIKLLVDAIQSIQGIEEKNLQLKDNIEKRKKYLHQLIKQYHDHKFHYFQESIKEQQVFNAIKIKIKHIINHISSDPYYIAFTNKWNEHVINLIQDKQKISELASNNLNPKNKKSTTIENDYFSPDEIKPKKKFSESQKASLLGQLKSFSKAFKIPPN